MFKPEEAMGNEQGCFIPHGFEESIQHLFFGLRVKVCRWLVEDQDRGIFQQGAGNF